MKHAAEGFEGVCSNTPKNDMQMFCAFRREDAPSRGLTAGFGIGPGVSPPLVIETYGSADLATHNAFSLRRMQIRLSSKHSKLRRHHLPYASIATYVCIREHTKKQSRKRMLLTQFFINLGGDLLSHEYPP